MFCDKRCSPGTTSLNRGDDIARERIFLLSANSVGNWEVYRVEGTLYFFPG